MSRFGRQRRWVAFLARQVAVVLGYVLVAQMGLRVVVIAGQVSPVWLPTGVAAFAVFTWGSRILPALFVGSFLASLSTGAPLGFCLMVGAGNALEGLVAAQILQRLFRFRPTLDRTKDVSGLVAAAAFGPVVSALVGTSSMLLFGLAPLELAGKVAWVWWLGNAMGALILAPVLFTLGGAKLRSLTARRTVELVSLCALVAVSGQVVFGGAVPMAKSLYEQAFLLFPAAIWAALRFGPLGSALFTLGVSLMAIAGTALGRGPFASQQVVDGVVVLQLFMAVLAVTAQLLAATWAERRRAQGQLVLSDRLASVGMVAAGVGHEINNPLAAVMLNLALLERELQGVPPAPAEERERRVRALVGEALYGAQRVRDIVGSLRVLSREGAAEKTPVNLNHLVELTLGLSRHELRNRGDLVKELGEVPPVLGHEARLGQVLLNLLVNAMHALEEPGEKGRQRVTVRTMALPPGRVVLEVEDTGVGIPREHLPRLFEPFFTTRAEGEGTGLGLFICKEIVEEHRGELSVESEVGVGTTFRVSLPAATADALARESAGGAEAGALTGGTGPAQAAEPPGAAEPSIPPGALVSRRRILIVDDEARFAQSLRLLLSVDHDVEVSTCAEEALVRVRNGDTFDAILCDLQMPGVSGMELWRRLHASDEALAGRMLFISGGAYSDEARRFVDQMTGRVLEKPVPPDVLVSRVAKLLGRPSPAGP